MDKRWISQNTAMATWYEAVIEAESLTETLLPSGVEAYIVIMLQRYCQEPLLLNQPLALDYLQGLQAGTSQLSQVKLQHVGDQCLLLSGLFPDKATARHVTIKYYIELGQSAYGHCLGQQSSAEEFSPFAWLSTSFHSAREVLAGLRSAPVHNGALPQAQKITAAKWLQ